MTQESIDRWFGKEDVPYIYNGILLGDRKEWNCTMCVNMVGHRGHCSERNKWDINSNTVYYLCLNISACRHREEIGGCHTWGMGT